MRIDWSFFFGGIATAFVWAILLSLGDANAHDGETHGESSAPTLATELGPCLALSSERVELVAVPQNGALLIYVDDFASNRPLAGLQVQISGGGRSAAAQEVEPGTYRTDLDVLPPLPARLRFELRGANLSESLEGELPAAPPPAKAHSHLPKWLWPSLAAALLLIAAAVAALLWRRRRAG